MNKIKLIEVKECEPDQITKVATICDNCGWLINSNVVKVKVDVDDLISRVNDELDITKVRIERIIRGIEG